MNRRSFIAKCFVVLGAVVFPWKSAFVGEITSVKDAFDMPTFAEIASKFQWSCEYDPVRSVHAMMCSGKFQDGLEYACAEFVDFDGEYVEGEYTQGIWKEADPEVILSEIVTNFNMAMRTRFNQIEGRFDLNAYGACVDFKDDCSKNS